MQSSTLQFVLMLMLGCNTLFAATRELPPDLTRTPSEPQREPQSESEILATVDVLPAPPIQTRFDTVLDSTLYYQNALSLRFGASINPSDFSDTPLMIYGLSYQFDRKAPWHGFWGADVLPDGSLMPNAGLKYTLHMDQPVRPYLRAGFRTRLIAKEQLGTLVNYNNFQGLAAFGVECLHANKGAWLLESEFAAGIQFKDLIFVMGYSFIL